MIADPLGRFDCVPVVCGANAAVGSRADRVHNDVNVLVRALRRSYNADHQTGDGSRTSLAAIAADLWRQACVTPDEVDVVALCDDYPVMALVQLADLGFASEGDLHALIARVRTHAFAVNTSGGPWRAVVSGYGMVQYRYGMCANAVVLEKCGDEVSIELDRSGRIRAHGR